MTAHNLSLGALRQAYESGRQTARELITELRQQALAQSDYNAWIHLLSEVELEPYLARLDSECIDNLPLYGVPFAIKDNIDLANIPTTAACPDFTYTPDESAVVVATLIAAGAVPLGKTNLDQFATGLVGVRSPYGEGKNSLNPDYVSGGSSAGSAIATALGQVSFALGTDTAGSGRVPAVFNNLIGHKPSKGLLSNRGLVPACRSLDCISLMTLNCEDAAALMDIVAQYDPEDTYSRPNPHFNRARYFGGHPSDSFCFAIPAEPFFAGNRETQALFEHSVERLCALGGEVKRIDFEPFEEAARLLYEGPWVCERALATEGVQASKMLPVIAEIISQAQSKSGTDAFAAQYRLAELKRHCNSLIAEFDFVLTPTCPTQFTRAELAEQPIARNSVLGTYTNFVNLLDYAATAVPVGFTRCGVGWGVTLFAHAFSDIKLLTYANLLHRDCALSLGATGIKAPPRTATPGPQAPSETVELVVCGAHLEGQPLNWQLTERGGTRLAQIYSAPAYQLYALSDGKRPGMVRNEEQGAAIEVEVWSLPMDSLGSFVAAIPSPLGIGKVELEDGRWLSGFICEASGLINAIDITAFGGWRAWRAHKTAESKP
jgi:allophanate hydrolase